MKMKKFINDPENLTPELLEGFAAAHSDLSLIHISVPWQWWSMKCSSILRTDRNLRGRPRQQRDLRPGPFSVFSQISFSVFSGYLRACANPSGVVQ